MLIFQTGRRVAFGKPILAQANIQQDIAKSRIEIEQCRLLTLKAAHMMDTVGNKVRNAYKLKIVRFYLTKISFIKLLSTDIHLLGH